MGFNHKLSFRAWQRFLPHQREISCPFQGEKKQTCEQHIRIKPCTKITAHSKCTGSAQEKGESNCLAGDLSHLLDPQTLLHFDFRWAIERHVYNVCVQLSTLNDPVEHPKQAELCLFQHESPSSKTRAAETMSGSGDRGSSFLLQSFGGYSTCLSARKWSVSSAYLFCL